MNEPGLDAELAFCVLRDGSFGEVRPEDLDGRLLRVIAPHAFAEFAHSRLHGPPPTGRVFFGLTMLNTARMDNLEECVSSVIRDGVPGDLIECGVWRGGAVIFMRALLAAFGDTERTVWVADSFAGLPPLGPRDGVGVEDLTPASRPDLAVTRREVEEGFEQFGLLDEQVAFLEGWFHETLPTAPMAQLAVLRLDGDLYESTSVPLRELYDRVSPGGYVIVDDYYVFPGSRAAVDEFRAGRGIEDPLVEIDWAGVYWRKQPSQLDTRRRG